LVQACRQEAQKKGKKPRGEWKGVPEVLDVLEDMRRSGMKCGDVFLARTLADHLWNDPLHQQVWPDAKDEAGLAKAIGDVLGKNRLNLKRKGRGFVMPEVLPEVQEDGSLSDPDYSSCDRQETKG
jgi:hypothetical protein